MFDSPNKRTEASEFRKYVIWMLILPVIGFILVLFYGVYKTDTQFAPEFTSKGWRSIDGNSSIDDVITYMGRPISISQYSTSEFWVYNEIGAKFEIRDNRVVAIETSQESDVSDWNSMIGASVSELRNQLGKADQYVKADDGQVWHYSESPSNSNYWSYIVVINRDKEQVLFKRRSFYFD